MLFRSVGISIPIYNGGKIKQQVRVQESQAERQQLILKEKQQELDKNFLLATEELRSARERLTRAPEQVAVATKTWEVTKTKFRLGTALYLEVVSAANGLQKALLNQLNTQYQTCVAEMELSRLRGIRFWE